MTSANGCVALSRATRRLRPGRRIARLYQTETDCSPSRPPGRARPPQRGRAPRRSDHETKNTRGRTPPRGAARHAPSVNASRQNLRERSLQVSAPRATAGGVHEEKNASAHAFRCLPRQNVFHPKQTLARRARGSLRSAAHGPALLAARAHGARELEHRAAAEDALDLADRAALREALRAFFFRVFFPRRITTRTDRTESTRRATPHAPDSEGKIRRRPSS